MPAARSILIAGLLLVIIVLILPGCTTRGDSTPTAAAEQGQPGNDPVGEPTTGLPAINDLAELFAPHRSSLTESNLLLHGRGYATFFPFHRVSSSGNFGVYEGNWPDHGGVSDDLAFATYILRLDGFDRDLQIHYGWETPPSDYGDAWIGLANWDEECWDWRRCLDRGWLAYSSFEPYLDADDYMFVTVALAADETCRLEYLQAGPPQVFAAVDATPPISVAPTHITASAMGSSVAVGDITNHEWDWDGDGVYEESTGTTAYSTRDLPAGLGKYTVGLRITTDYGIQDTAEASYELIDGWAHSWGQTSDDGINAAIGYGYQAIYAVGYTINPNQGNDVLLLKYDYLGNYYWARTWGASETDHATSVTTISGGDIVLTGFTSSYGAGGLDVLVQRWNSAGELVWSRTWGGSASDYGRRVIPVNNQLYIVGGTTSYGAGADDCLLLKYDLDGNLVWARTWGGGSIDHGCDVATSYSQFTLSYTLHVAGFTGSYGPAWAKNSLVYLRYNEDGDLTSSYLWPCEAAQQDARLSVYGLNGTTVYLAGQVNNGATTDIALVEFSTDPGPVAVRWGTVNAENLEGLYRLGDALILIGSSNGLLPQAAGFLASFSESGGLNGAKAWAADANSSFFGCRYLGGNGLLVCGRANGAAGGFTAVNAGMETIDQDWISVLGSSSAPAGITASPLGTVVAVSDGIRDTYAGGNCDGFICVTGAP